MSFIKQVIRKRQAIRLHIESMRSTLKNLKDRAKHHDQDVLAYQTAHNAVSRLQKKIDEAELELHVLEEKWTW